MGQCNLQDEWIDASYDYKDTVTRLYLAEFDSVVESSVEALALAQSLGPDQVPLRRQKLSGSFLFCTSINGKRTDESRKAWRFTVQFTPPPEGEDDDQQVVNPLLRPPVFGLRYIDEEYVVKKARNVEDLGASIAMAGGPSRPAGTLGPIVNGAGRRPDEPIVRTRRKLVIVISKNYPDLGEIIDLNDTYQESCNGDTITLGNTTVSPRRLKYEVTHEGGRQEENGIVYYPGVTEITLEKTTDLVLDNVGFEYYDLATGNLKRAQDDDGEPTAEPVNLTLSGLKSEDEEPTQITYRDLEELDYAGFFS